MLDDIANTGDISAKRKYAESSLNSADTSSRSVNDGIAWHTLIFVKFISMKRVFIEDTDDGYSTDKEAARLKKKVNASKPRATKTTSVIRKNVLENDEHTRGVSAHEVTCAACSQKIKLHSTRVYDTAHWDHHKASCPRITLKQTIRTAKKVVVKKVSVQLSCSLSYHDVSHSHWNLVRNH